MATISTIVLRARSVLTLSNLLMERRMSNKWKLAFFTLLCLNILATLWAFIYMDADGERAILSSYMNTAIDDYKDGGAPYIDLTTISSFSWDRIHFFGPYSSCQHVTKSLSAPFFWFGCKSSQIEYYENGSLIVFTKKGRVVQYVLYEGFFMNSYNENGIAYQDAHFTIDKNNKVVWIQDK